MSRKPEVLIQAGIPLLDANFRLSIPRALGDSTRNQVARESDSSLAAKLNGEGIRPRGPGARFPMLAAESMSVPSCRLAIMASEGDQETHGISRLLSFG